MESRLSIIGVFAFALGNLTQAAPASVRFTPSGKSVEVYDFLEITLRPERPDAVNPFADVQVTGGFTRVGAFTPTGEAPVMVEGFCDSADGDMFRIRFMPSQAGQYSYSVKFQQGDFEATHSGAFTATKSRRAGPLRVDPEHPFHFVQEGPGNHYFWNSTTTYGLIGWHDDRKISSLLDRLAKLKVNRVRAALIPPRVRSGRQWFEPMVTNNAAFDFRVNVWPAARPDSFDVPGFDTARFNVAHFQKYERLLRHARERGIVVSVIFYVDGRLPGVDPFRKDGMGGELEQRYYRYVVARFSAFANATWDVANEYRLFRNDAWAEQMGALIKRFDPYQHLTSTHGHDTFRFRKSPWADFAMYQSWDEHGGYGFMLKNRAEQLKAGRPMPQVNEEYGYEDHYPQGWGESRKAPARSADNRRRLAWEMTMAGGYQTTGERANAPGGGGWINGGGTHDMVLLKSHAHLMKFFTSVPWWTTEPHNDIVSAGAYCLSAPGQVYLIYLPHGGSATVNLADGRYTAKWFNPRTGKFAVLPDALGGQWESPSALNAEDWALMLRRRN